MAKEITCEILKDHFNVDEDDESAIKICEVKWNGRSPKGYDIRKYDKNENKLYKGLTVSYNGFNDLIYKAIESGLVDLDEVERRVKIRKSEIISNDDFAHIFDNVRNDRYYQRDNYGLLHNVLNGNIVISSMRKKNKKS